MFTRLLVPLDGSSRAESVLPAALYFAKTLGLPVSLLHVLEKNAPEEVHDERHLRLRDEASAYLASVKSRLESMGIAADTHVHEEIVEKVVEGIARHAQELSADLIMMCTHGGGGVKRLVWGTVAQQTAAAGSVPVFFVPPEKKPAPSYACCSIALPLDGTREHKTGIPVALFLADKFHAAVSLLYAVPRQHEVSGKWSPVSRLLPHATQEMLDLSAEQGEEYLKMVRVGFDKKDIPVSSALIRGEPGKAVPSAIKKLKPDLVILGTHGRSGLEAFFEGSLAPKISDQCGVPILLVPADKS